MLSVIGRQDIKNKTCSKLNHVIGLQLTGRNTTNSDISGLTKRVRIRSNMQLELMVYIAQNFTHNTLMTEMTPMSNICQLLHRLKIPNLSQI